MLKKQKIKVLFVCVHNSFRSQIAETILNHKYGEHFIAESAGLEKKEISPLAIQVMKEYGIDISQHSVDSVFDFYKEGRLYHYIITVCSKEVEAQCPIFPGIRNRMNWDLEDPEEFTGTLEEKLEEARILRDKIETLVDEFVNYAD
ncbi:MAG: arsenate reductase ArsC [Eubacteriaceae bacterium]|nr:arsenate reductase ArsC [Eubacteriaceae bacterium]